MKINTISALVAGIGNIGSHLVPPVARDPGTRRLALVDPDVVEEKNLTAQQFDRSDLGRPKVDAVRDRILRVRPELEVLALKQEVEDLPAGFFRNKVILCLDSNGPRQVSAERAWKVGGHLFDCAVNAAAGLVRITEVGMGGECACLECGWSSESGSLSIRHRCQDTPPTNAPAALGSLVGSLAALRLQSSGEKRQAATSELVASSTRIVRATLERNPTCRFNHRRLARVELFGEFNPAQTIGSLFDQLQCEELQLLDLSWDRRLRCSACGHMCETLKAVRDPLAEPCSFCGHSMDRIGFYAVPSLRKAHLPASLLSHSLRELNLQPGDIVIPDRAPQGFQLGDPFSATATIPEPALTP